jgi:hypothetical protein
MKKRNSTLALSASRICGRNYYTRSSVLVAMTTSTVFAYKGRRRTALMMLPLGR